MVKVTQRVRITSLGRFHVDMGDRPMLVRQNQHPTPVSVDAYAIGEGRLLVDDIFAHPPHQSAFALPGTGQLQMMIGVPG